MDDNELLAIHEMTLLSRELAHTISGVNLFVSTLAAELRTENPELIKRIEKRLHAFKVEPLTAPIEAEAKRRALKICSG